MLQYPDTQNPDFVCPDWSKLRYTESGNRGSTVQSLRKITGSIYIDFMSTEWDCSPVHSTTPQDGNEVPVPLGKNENNGKIRPLSCSLT